MWMAPNPLHQAQDTSSKKKIYFIRHGESETNAGTIFRGAHSALTEKGKAQACFIAERCTRLPIEILISSSLKRAQETAVIIGETIHKEIETSDLFVERRRPSIQKGMAKNDPISVEADKSIFDNFSVPGFRHSDEENFDDLKQRAGEALSHLSERKEKHIAVVTHGFFMRVVIAFAVFGPELTGKECERFIRSFHMENTGITVLGFDGVGPHSWWLWVWNDHSHLAELEN